MSWEGDERRAIPLTERRRGLHELTDQVHCLRDEFVSEQARIAGLISEMQEWQGEVKPVIQAIHRAMWALGFASVLISVLVTIVTWVWLEDHSLLRVMKDLVVTNTERLNGMQKTDERLEQMFLQLMHRPEGH